MATNRKPIIVQQTPLAQLWNERDDIGASRTEDLGSEQIKEFLRLGTVQFVLASVGHPLKWIPLSEAFTFWAQEAKSHLVEPEEQGFFLSDFPDHYAYCATLWQREAGDPIVLLEKHH